MLKVYNEVCEQYRAFGAPLFWDVKQKQHESKALFPQPPGSVDV